jgi:hypothetical protein
VSGGRWHVHQTKHSPQRHGESMTTAPRGDAAWIDGGESVGRSLFHQAELGPSCRVGPIRQSWPHQAELAAIRQSWIRQAELGPSGRAPPKVRRLGEVSACCYHLEPSLRMWRNWQTRKIQVLVGVKSRGGSIPLIRIRARLSGRARSFHRPRGLLQSRGGQLTVLSRTLDEVDEAHAGTPLP